MPGYTCRIFATNREEDAATLWRDYNQHECVEQRIEELKNDLPPDASPPLRWCDRTAGVTPPPTRSREPYFFGFGASCFG
jgi:hypothetical protein